TISAVRRCNFMQFKNYFSEDDSRYALDVLESGALLDQEIEVEHALREKLGDTSKVSSTSVKRRAKVLVEEAHQSNIALRNAQAGDIWVRRVRIRSPALLRIFGKVQGETWSSQARVYHRPFCAIIHYLPAMKRVLDELEERWGSQPETVAGSPEESNTGDDGTMHGTATAVGKQEDGGAVDDSPAALADLRCFVKFVETEIIPGSQRFTNLDHSSDAKVRFSDLCYLFKPGEIIYKPVEGDVPGFRDARMGQRAWRIYYVDSYNRILTPTSAHRKYAINDREESDESFAIMSYCIEYTGDEFCVVTNTFKIPPFDGSKPVSALPVFPIRFVADYARFMETAVRSGESVLRFIETKHATYNAWSVMRTPKGGFLVNPEGVMVKHPEHINSEVMVDFEEAFQACPTWQPKRVILKPDVIDHGAVTDEFMVRWQSDPDRAKVLKETSEIMLSRTGVHSWERNKFVSEDPFLAAVCENHQRGELTTKEFLRREDMALIACRVFAYVFRERKFAQLDVHHLKPSAQSRDALDSLKIPQATKELIQGSVRGHFLHKEAEKRNGEEGLSLDVIQGKGTGLFILFHGVPGVGKTATAEAVAQANGKPLFKITCGDLGLTPTEVESSLRHIFRLASIWDCVLLMDEVDTFFSQRSKGDAAMTKNALVSVFLRVLDYYTGILFLTTNRAGALDEAFKSRIHYKLYFPPLSRQQTLEIWKLNIQRLQHIEGLSKGRRPLEISESAIMSFAEEQFDNNRKGTNRWNGRQIRNAFQVARSLALYEATSEAERLRQVGSDEPSPPAVLNIKHFQLMHDITEFFDQYMEEVFSGMNDGELALEMEHRADHWTSNHWT
ncbi:hypothetical protein GQ53DRAFT_607518, partial [Thozetella sp. PMI_491]